MSQIDPTYLAAVLAAEYPLIDETLISVLLSDYPVSELGRHLDEIRDSLGILEASVVPDVDDASERREEGRDAEDAEDGAGRREGYGPESDVEGVGEMERMGVAWGNEEAGDDESTGMGTRKSAKAKTRQVETAASGSASSETARKESRDRARSEPTEPITDELQLLQSLFPSLSCSVILETKSDRDLQDTIDSLLSLALIRETGSRGYWPGETAGGGHDRDGLGRVGVYGNEAGHDGWAPVPVLSGGNAGTGTIGRSDALCDAPCGMSLPTARARSQAAHRSEAESLATYLHDLIPWRPVDFFLGFFGASCAVNAWGKHGEVSLYDAVQRGLSLLSASAGPAVSKDKSGLDTGVLLQEIYGLPLGGSGSSAGMRNAREMTGEERRRARDLEVCVRVAGGDVGVVVDLVDLLESLRRLADGLEGGSEDDADGAGTNRLRSVREQTSDISDDDWAKPSTRLPGRMTRPQPAATTKPPRPIPGSHASHVPHAHAADHANLVPSSPTPVPATAGDPHPTNWRTVRSKPSSLRKKSSAHPLAASIPAYKLGITPHDRTPGSLYARSGASGGATRGSVDACLAQAGIERARRESAIRAAGQSYMAGNRGARGAVAGHYAREAREAGERVRELEMRAAVMVVDAQLEAGRGGGSRVIDLHYLTVAEAVGVAERAVGKWWDEEKERRAGGGRKEDGALVVVVGAGRHSAGNRAVIGPAVAGMLSKAGWKVDRGATSTGYLVVHGR